MPDKKIRFNEFSPQSLLSAISNPMRTEMLKILSRSESLTFTEFLKELNLDQSQTGKFSYHLKALKESNIIIEGPDGGYFLTELGRKIVDFLWEIDDITRQAKSDFYVRRSEGEFENFDRTRIKDSLIREADMPQELADKIAKEAEERLIKLNVRDLTSSLIREFVNAILLEKGYEEYRHSLTRLGLPIYDVSQLIIESAKVKYSNPNSLIYKAGRSIFDQYLLQKIIPWEISDAHIKNFINIPNVSEWIFKPLSINHDLTILLSGIAIEKNSGDQKCIEKILDHLSNTVQDYSTHVSEDQIFNNFNYFLAPFTKGISKNKLRKFFKSFFERLSEFERIGNLTIYLDSNLPIKNFPSIIKIDNMVYDLKEFEEEITRLYNILIEIFPAVTVAKNSGVNLVLRLEEKDIEENQKIFCDLANNIVLLKNLFFFNKTQESDEKLDVCNHLGFKCDLKWKKGWKDGVNRTGILDYVNLNLIKIADESNNLKAFQDKLKHFLNLSYNALSMKYKQINERLNKNYLLPMLSQKYGTESYYKIENSVNQIALFGLNYSLEKLTNKGIITDKYGEKLNLLEALSEEINRFQKLSGLRWALTQTPTSANIERLLSKEEQFRYSNIQELNSIIPIIKLEDILEFGIDPTQKKLIQKINNHLNGGYLYTFKTKDLEINKNIIELLKKILDTKLIFFKFY